MNILYIEDDVQVAIFGIRWLNRIFPAHLADRHGLVWVKKADEAIHWLSLSHEWGLIVSDFNLGPGRTGGDVLKFVKDTASQLEQRFVFFCSPDNRDLSLHHSWVDKPCDYATFEWICKEAAR